MGNISNPAGGDKQLWMYKMVALYRKIVFMGVKYGFSYFGMNSFMMLKIILGRKRGGGGGWNKLIT